MSRQEDLAAEIEKAESDLAALGQAREQALARLAALRAAGSTTGTSPQLRLPIANGVPAPRTGAEKIRLFRSLFRGRTDVFPKRWENAKQERSGYAPACANEWVRGTCEKPKVSDRSPYWFRGHVAGRPLLAYAGISSPRRIKDIVTRSISGHAIEAMQEKYSTVQMNEMRASIGKIISIAKVKEALAA